MSTVSRALALLLALTFFAAHCRAAEEPQRVPITLQDAIEMALSNNLDIRWSKADIKVNEGRLGMAWGDFDPQFNVNGSGEHYEIPQNAEEYASTNGVSGKQKVYYESNWKASSGLQGSLPFGTKYGLTMHQDTLNNSTNQYYSQTIAGIFHPEYSSGATLELRQPLLRDFGFAANLVQVRIQRKDTEIADLNWLAKVREAVGSVITFYYEMQFGMENVQVRAAAVEADRKLLEQNQRRFELGFLSVLDVRQAEVAVSEDEEALIVAKNQFVESQFKLQRQILGEHKSRPYVIYEPVGTLKQRPLTTTPREKLLAVAYQNRADYLSSIKELEKGDVRLRYARNQLLPRVDMVGSYGYSGLKGSRSDSIQDTFAGTNQEQTIGVQVSVPLGSVKERNQLIAIKGLQEEAQIRFKQAELNIGIDVDTALSRLDLNRQHIETAAQSRMLAEEAVRLANRRQEQGQLSSFDVIEQRKKLYQAQTRELGAIADYNASVVQLGLATGTILQDNGVVVDPPKPRKEPKKSIFSRPK